MNHWQYDPAHDLGLRANQRYCSPLRETDFISSALRWVWLALVRAIFKCWNRLEIDGLENLPAQPPFVMIANHASHLDAVLLASALPLRWRDRVSPLAAGDYFFASTSQAGFSACVLNALPIWRDRLRGRWHELGHLRERLIRQAAIYIVFPEGSRSRDGELHPFKAGFAMLVAATPIPVVPCHLDGSFSALPPDKHFVLPHKIVLRIGKPMTFETVPHHSFGWRQIAATAQSAVAGLGPEKQPNEHRNGQGHLDALKVIARRVRFSLHAKS